MVEAVLGIDVDKHKLHVALLFPGKKPKPKAIANTPEGHDLPGNGQPLVRVAMRSIKQWTMPIKDWKPALNRFVIEFESRLPKEICP